MEEMRIDEFRGRRLKYLTLMQLGKYHIERLWGVQQTRKVTSFIEA